MLCQKNYLNCAELFTWYAIVTASVSGLSFDFTKTRTVSALLTNSYLSALPSVLESIVCNASVKYEEFSHVTIFPGFNSESNPFVYFVCLIS